MKLLKKFWHGNGSEEEIAENNRIIEMRYYEEGCGEPFIATVITTAIVGFLFYFDWLKLLVLAVILFWFYYSVDRTAFKDGYKHDKEPPRKIDE